MLDIVIVNYNSTKLLQNCLGSIHRSLNGNRDQVKIYVQDNASAEDLETVAHRYPAIKMQANPTNLGFAKAVNQALRSGEGDYVVLLNPDTGIVNNFFESCISFMETHPEVGILAPRIYDADGSLQNSARGFPTPLTAFFGRSSFLSKRFPGNGISEKNLLSLQSDGKRPMEVDWVSGACMVIRRKAIEEVGLLDERFFMYWEDADFCKRMWEKGWKVIYFPKAHVYHHVGGSSSKIPIRSRYEFHKSVFHLVKKYNPDLIPVIGPLVLSLLGVRFCLTVLPYLLPNGHSKNGGNGKGMPAAKAASELKPRNDLIGLN